MGIKPKDTLGNTSSPAVMAFLKRRRILMKRHTVTPSTSESNSDDLPAHDQFLAALVAGRGIPKGVVERGSRTKGRRGVWPKAEKKK